MKNTVLLVFSRSASEEETGSFRKTSADKGYLNQFKSTSLPPLAVIKEISNRAVLFL